MADFDGDSQPDVAVTKMETRGAGYVYWLEVNLSTKSKEDSPRGNDGWSAVNFSIFGLHLTPRDVDGDHDLDIVVTVGMNRQPVAVWINDGHGRFEEGDLAAYPALSPADFVFFSSPGATGPTNTACDQGRRSRFGLLSRGVPQAVLHPERQQPARLALLISRFPVDRTPARAPPLSL
jgi:hypothetical protein